MPEIESSPVQAGFRRNPANRDAKPREPLEVRGFEPGKRLAVVTPDQRAVSMELGNGQLYKQINSRSDLRPTGGAPIVPGKEALRHGENLRGGAGVPAAAVAKPEYLALPANTPGQLSVVERNLIERQQAISQLDPRRATPDQAQDIGSAFVLNKVMGAKLEGGAKAGQEVLSEMRGRFVDLQKEGRYPGLERLEAQGLAAPGASRVLPKEAHHAYVDGVQKTLGMHKDRGVITASQALQEERITGALEQVRVHGGPQAVIGKAEVAPIGAATAGRDRLGAQLQQAVEGMPMEKRLAATPQILQAMESARNRIQAANQFKGVTAQAAIKDQAMKVHGAEPPKSGISEETQKYLLERANKERMPIIQQAVQQDFQKLSGYLQHRADAISHTEAGRPQEAKESLKSAIDQWEKARPEVRPETMAALRAQGFGPGQIKEQVRGVHPDAMQEAWGRTRLDNIVSKVPAEAQEVKEFLYRAPGKQTEEFFPVAAYKQNGANFLAFEHQGQVLSLPEESLRQNPRHPGHGIANALAEASGKAHENPAVAPSLAMSRKGFVEMPREARAASPFRGVDLRVA